MPALAAMFGGGCAAIGDRLIRIEDGAELARWWAEETVEDKIVELQDRRRALREARARHPRRSGSARRMGVRDPRHVLGNTARDDRGVGRRLGGIEARSRSGQAALGGGGGGGRGEEVGLGGVGGVPVVVGGEVDVVILVLEDEEGGGVMDGGGGAVLIG